MHLKLETFNQCEGHYSFSHIQLHNAVIGHVIYLFYCLVLVLQINFFYYSIIYLHNLGHLSAIN